MTTQTKPDTKPEEVLPRFCGYCGRCFKVNFLVFISHIDACEKILSEKAKE